MTDQKKFGRKLLMDFWKKFSSKVPGWTVGVVLGVCFLILGAVSEQFADIYRKAIRICLECIGIG